MVKAATLPLLTAVLLLAGCSSPPADHTASDWDRHGLQLEGERGLPLPHETRNRTRGSDDPKLFFNPGQPGPGVNSIHHGR